jgi:hypothetical protein
VEHITLNEGGEGSALFGDFKPHSRGGMQNAARLQIAYQTRCTYQWLPNTVCQIKTGGPLKTLLVGKALR